MTIHHFVCQETHCKRRRLPSVVSDVICWAPAYWRAPVDDVLEIARVGRHLLCDPLAPRDGYRALVANNADALVAWKAFLAT